MASTSPPCGSQGYGSGVLSEYEVSMGEGVSFTGLEATAIVDGALYSVSYAAWNGAHGDGIRHMMRAVESFEAVPSELPR